MDNMDVDEIEWQIVSLRRKKTGFINLGDVLLDAAREAKDAHLLREEATHHSFIIHPNVPASKLYSELQAAGIDWDVQTVGLDPSSSSSYIMLEHRPYTGNASDWTDDPPELRQPSVPDAELNSELQAAGIDLDVQAAGLDPSTSSSYIVLNHLADTGDASECTDSPQFSVPDAELNSGLQPAGIDLDVQTAGLDPSTSFLYYILEDEPHTGNASEWTEDSTLISVPDAEFEMELQDAESDLELQPAGLDLSTYYSYNMLDHKSDTGDASE